MIKNKTIKLIITSVIIMLPVLAGLILWNQLPDQMPTHWNASGEIDGWSSKGFAVFGFPSILLGAHLLCMMVTYADPKKQNISARMLNLVLCICPVMSILLSALTYAAALGKEIDVNTLAPVLIGIIFIVVGMYLPKCQHNYTVGIKLPWTLHDEDNWKATHRFAGPVWVAGGVLIILSALLSFMWLMVVILLLIVTIPSIYSYLYYKKH